PPDPLDDRGRVEPPALLLEVGRGHQGDDGPGGRRRALGDDPGGGRTGDAGPVSTGPRAGLRWEKARAIRSRGRASTRWLRRPRTASLRLERPFQAGSGF